VPRHLPDFLALVCLLAACQGDPAAPPSQSTDADQPVVLRAGTRSFTLAQVQTQAQASGTTPDEAAQALATAALVADEGARLGQPCPAQQDLLDCSQALLAILFPDNPDCPGVTELQLDQFYEASYSPDWLFDYYEGAVLRVGLNLGIKGPEAQAELRRLAALWNYRKELDEALARLAPKGYKELPFRVLLKPDQAPEAQGWQSGLPPMALAALAAMHPGQTGQALVVEDLALVLRLDLHRPPQAKTDPAVRLRLRQELCSQRAKEARKNLQQELRRSGFVELKAPLKGPKRR
jgi:hypothetical protein